MNSSSPARWVRALALVALLLLPVFLSSAVLGGEGDATALAPKAEQARTTGTIVALLGKAHYRRLPVDDKLSERLLDRYLTFLDPGRVHFLATDISEFAPLRDKLDDGLLKHDLGAAFRIFNRFQQRRLERLEYLNGLVARGLDKLDLEADESIRMDRKEAAWPEDLAAARDLWRRLLKADVISLRLAGRSMEEIAKTLARRYEDQLHRARQVESRDVFSLYMNAFAQLHDPHTTFFPPRAAENFEIEMKLSLTGIGARLTLDGEYTKINDLVPGGPAEKSGKLRPGDRITGVAQGDDGEILDVVGWRLDEVVDKIRGPKGTVVRLEILGANEPDGGPTHLVRLVRDKVTLEDQAAKGRIVEVERDGKKLRVGVIRLPSFYIDAKAASEHDPDYRSSTRDVARILGEFASKGVNGVVLDLRNNGGGALHEAIRVTGLFVGRRPVVAVKDSLGRQEVLRSEEDAVYEGPLLVLVNRMSASASEIVAGAIQDYGRGILAGGTTFGKGTVQNLAPLDRGRLKLTLKKFYRVSGASTQGRGVVPDVPFPAQFDHELVGESALPDALPWDSIERIVPEADSEIRKRLPDLVRRHEARIASDPEFIYYAKRQEIVREARKKTELSLDLEQREKEREELDARLLAAENELRAARGEKPLASLSEKGEEASRDEDSDAWVREAANILADLLLEK